MDVGRGGDRRQRRGRVHAVSARAARTDRPPAETSAPISRPMSSTAAGATPLASPGRPATRGSAAARPDRRSVGTPASITRRTHPTAAPASTRCGLGTCQGAACTCNPTPATVTVCPPAPPPRARASTPPRNGANCGTCGNACVPAEVCSASSCQCLSPNTSCARDALADLHQHVHRPEELRHLRHRVPGRPDLLVGRVRPDVRRGVHALQRRLRESPDQCRPLRDVRERLPRRGRPAPAGRARRAVRPSPAGRSAARTGPPVAERPARTGTGTSSGRPASRPTSIAPRPGPTTW